MTACDIEAFDDKDSNSRAYRLIQRTEALLFQIQRIFCAETYIECQVNQRFAQIRHIFDKTSHHSSFFSLAISDRICYDQSINNKSCEGREKTKEKRNMNMNEILKVIAEQNDTTIEDVRREMELAISSAKDTPGFKAIFGDEVPSIEEFIIFGVASLHLLHLNPQ